MSTRQTARRLASHGRYGDTMLVHMNPLEVAGIASLVPGGLTTNPQTGLPEAFFFLPFLASLFGAAAPAAAAATAAAPALLAGGAGLASGLTAGAGAAGLTAAAAPVAAAAPSFLGSLSSGIGSLFGGGAGTAASTLAGGAGVNTLAGAAAADTIAPAATAATTAAATPAETALFAQHAATLGPFAGGAGAAPYTPAISAPWTAPVIPGAGAYTAATGPLPEVTTAIPLARPEIATEVAGGGGGIGSLFSMDNMMKGLIGLQMAKGLMPSGHHDSGQKAKPGAGKERPTADDTHAEFDHTIPNIHTVETGERDYFPRSSFTVHGFKDGGKVSADEKRTSDKIKIYSMINQGYAGRDINPDDIIHYMGDMDPEYIGTHEDPVMHQGLVGLYGLKLHERMPSDRTLLPTQGGYIDGRPAVSTSRGFIPIEPVSPGFYSIKNQAKLANEYVPSDTFNDMVRGMDRGYRRGGRVRGYADGGIVSLANGGGVDSQMQQPQDMSMPLNGVDNGQPMGDIPTSDFPSSQIGSSFDQANTVNAPSGNDKELIAATIAAISGKIPNPEPVILAFIKNFGEAAFQHLVSQFKGMGQGQSVPSGGDGRLISGPGDGTSDSVMAQLKGPSGTQQAALSDGEYVVPAKAVSALGNGSTDAGARRLDQMVQAANGGLMRG